MNWLDNLPPFSKHEWWYNTTYHSIIKRSLFEALYDYKPSQMGYGPHLVSKTVGVEQWMIDHQTVTQQIKLLLQKAHERMSHYANKKRSERKFEVGDWVYLKLKPYKQLSLRKSYLWKLSPKFAGPFLVVQKVGEVAYKLQLPDSARLHPVFHVSLLKKSVGQPDQVVSTVP